MFSFIHIQIVIIRRFSSQSIPILSHAHLQQTTSSFFSPQVTGFLLLSNKPEGQVCYYKYLQKKTTRGGDRTRGTHKRDQQETRSAAINSVTTELVSQHQTRSKNQRQPCKPNPTVVNPLSPLTQPTSQQDQNRSSSPNPKPNQRDTAANQFERQAQGQIKTQNKGIKLPFFFRRSRAWYLLYKKFEVRNRTRRECRRERNKKKVKKKKL